MNLLESMTNTVSVVYVRLGFTLGLIASFPGPFQTGLGTRLELSGCSFVSSPAQLFVACSTPTLLNCKRQKAEYEPGNEATSEH